MKCENCDYVFKDWCCYHKEIYDGRDSYFYKLLDGSKFKLRKLKELLGV